MIPNYFALLVVTIASFIGGYVWFTPLFGRVWMKIHHTHKLSKEEMREAMKGTGKLMVAEFLLTLVLNFFLAIIVTRLSSLTYVWITTLCLWTGFVLPSITSSVLWGNDDKKVMAKKIALSAGYRLVAMVAAAYIFFIW